MPIIPWPHGRLRQEDNKFKANLGYINNSRQVLSVNKTKLNKNSKKKQFMKSKQVHYESFYKKLSIINNFSSHHYKKKQMIHKARKL
jgi:hypothetical protein